MPHYDEELVVNLADEWRDPAVCLKLEGAMPGNDVCSDVDYASVNGQVATGDLQKFDKKYPYPLINVEEGKCYRLRFIMMASNAENYIIRMAGHNMTLVGLDGVDVDPIQVTSFNIRIGERMDVILCADQQPGYFPMEMNYDYACDLTPGNFIPPGFHSVSSCRFYAFLHYQNQVESTYGAPNSPKGTGGGAHPLPVTGTRFDLTNYAEDWTKTKPVEMRPEPEEPDVRYHITLGLNGPLYDTATDEPLTKGKWYMDTDARRESWSKPTTPLLHTKNTGCNANVPVVDIPEDAKTVEVVINNLGPTAHNLHLHGMLFQVINVANFTWCTVNKTGCFLMPRQENPCPIEDRGFSDKNVSHNEGLLDLYWGCKYNAKKDVSTQNLHAPLRKDSFQVWQRSWAVIRFVADAPGIWQFHCHMEQHIPLGMVMALNVLPSKQPPIPQDVPTEGPCPVWSSKQGMLEAENAALRREVQDLREQNAD